MRDRAVVAALRRSPRADAWPGRRDPADLPPPCRSPACRVRGDADTRLVPADRTEGRGVRAGAVQRARDHRHLHDAPVAQVAVEWASASTESRHARRLSIVRGFLTMVRAAEPDINVPVAGFVRASKRRIPRILEPHETVALMEAARSLGPRGALRPHTVATVLRGGQARRLGIRRTRASVDRAARVFPGRVDRQGPRAWATESAGGARLPPMTEARIGDAVHECRCATSCRPVVDAGADQRPLRLGEVASEIEQGALADGVADANFRSFRSNKLFADPENPRSIAQIDKIVGNPVERWARGRSKNNFRFSLHGFDGVVPFGEEAVRCDA